MKYTAILGFAFAMGVWGQTITTSAGNSTWGEARGVAVDAAGNQYVSDYTRHRIYRVDRLGSTTVIAGTSSGYDGDGGPATAARLRMPAGLAIGTDGSIYVADHGNHRIRKIAPNGIITTIAGTGLTGITGDGGPATQARITAPLDVALDAAGNVYATDTGSNRIRRISPDGLMTTIAGTGISTFAGDGGPPLLANMNPQWLERLADGTIYFTDGVNQRVRRIANNVVTTVAGDGRATYSGDGGRATAASFASVHGIALDATGNLYVADSWESRVRRITPAGVITTYAGTGRAGNAGDGGPAASAQISGPVGLATDAAGNLYIAESGNGRIRKVSPVEPPSISAVSPAFLGKSGISANMYLEIYGANFGTSSRVWGSADFNGANAPTSLDGTRVLVNGVPAFVYFVDPRQININVPDDTATGPVNIQVVTPVGASNNLTVTRGQVSPTLQTIPLFLVGGKQFVVAQTGDFRTFIGNPGMVAGVAFSRAVPGQTVILYALGLGPTVPPTRAGVASAVNAALALPYRVTIGGREARVSFAGMVGSSIGLYQLNVEIPDVPAGDQTIELTVNGVGNGQDLVMAVGAP